MNTNEREDKLAQAAMALRASNPNGWNAFMAILAARVDEVTERMVSATPADLAKLQGVALEARALFKELDAAKARVERIQERNNGKTTGQR